MFFITVVIQTNPREIDIYIFGYVKQAKTLVVLQDIEIVLWLVEFDVNSDDSIDKTITITIRMKN